MIGRLWTVDTGLSGAIAITQDLKLIGFVDLEDFADRGRLMPQALRDHLLSRTPFERPELVLIEDATTRPDQHAGATLKTGRTFGHLEGLFIGMGLATKVVDAALWKALLGVPGKADKESTAKVVAMAHVHWPDAELVGPKGGLWHDRAESLLMARYAWKHVLGRELPVTMHQALTKKNLWE